MAVSEVEETDARVLLQAGKLHIGLVNCRIRPQLMVPRCYKCLGYVHYKRDCTGPDRRTVVGSMEDTGTCAAQAYCFLCATRQGQVVKYVTGSAKCAAFRAALTDV